MRLEKLNHALELLLRGEPLAPVLSLVLDRCRRRSGINNQTGAMIAILKGSGIISPRLRSSGPAANKRAPAHEVHPTLVELI
ncbi:MAG TPA: hypothetical protein VKN73_08545 [Desulfosalsimonadaceae bacterium]|nr:hypothetical protein [Desulfosalsimonadaceae bacterium]